jgi:primosomal protein N' (replication factor Y) (superfamily II helicase)
MKFLRVAVDVPLPRLFDYRCDDATQQDVGLRVVVPFGSKEVVGLVVEVAATSDLAPEKLRSAERILRDVPAFAPEWLALATFCSGYYQRPLGEVIHGALPPKLRSARPMPAPEACYVLTGAGRQGRAALPARSRARAALLERLASGPATETELAHLRKDARTLTRALLAAGWIAPAPLPEHNAPRFVTAHSLTAEQESAVAAVRSCSAFRVFLLYGVTGSGKTEVYLHAIAAALDAGKQALVLVPEIALTPALESAFRSRFPGARIVVQHSGMAAVERARGFLEAQAGAADIVLGTRLAVFVPMPRLALLVIDEEQDPSFKQQESLRYSARDVGILRAREASIPVVLCSATPSLETWHHATSGRYSLLALTQRAPAGAELPRVRLIDTGVHAPQDGIAEPLAGAITDRLARGEQTLVFLNRRGYAPVLACAQCGWVSGCPRCSTRLVVHLKQRQLRCHHCGYASRIVRACPDCGNVDLAPIGRGTQRLEASLVERFPSARILRIDSDTARGGLAGLFRRIESGEADILVGTQILAKGHHFERLTLVGVVNADAGLFSPNYRAPERMFQQLEQVAGRAGRAGLPGEVLIQTRYPGHPLYQALARHDYEGYARILLDQRRQAGFPPFVFEAALRAEADQIETAMRFLRDAAGLAPAPCEGVTLFDPAPMTLERIAGKSRAQLLAQSPSRAHLQPFLAVWSAALYAGRHPKVRWHFDVDPTEF